MPNLRSVPALVPLLLAWLPASSPAQTPDIHDSGGPILPQQAAYDVGFYDLDLEVFPERKAIAGSLAAHARAVLPLRHFVLDLDTLLAVDSVTAAGSLGTGALPYERRGGRIWIDLGRVLKPGEELAARVWYGGVPLEQPHLHRSWSDGFVWAATEDGASWISVVSVLTGSDIWWPVKDHPSDEPDSMAVRVTAPEELEVATNGRLRQVTSHGDGRRTWNWFVSDPINNYSVSINLAPYVLLEEDYESVTGERFPFIFWVLPEREEDGRALLPSFMADMRFLEETLGPYPFRQDKFGVVHTPYYGMEHQSINAYGSDFELNEWGFDGLFFHELTHEWWANMVTARDWKDWWIHESFGSYMTPLYVEHLHGKEAYREALPRRPFQFDETIPIAPRETQTTRSIYGGRIYGKGSFVLHTLRGLIGREALLTSIRRFAYPEPERENEPGCRCRLADTDEFVAIAEAVSGRSLQWFFDAYLHRAEIPLLDVAREEELLVLRWDTGGLPFPMPVEVLVGEDRVRLLMSEGVGAVLAPEGVSVQIDPEGWVLMHVRGEEVR